MHTSNDNTVRITMLGGSRSGKTCFMMAMYSSMQTGIDGFNFTSKDADADIEFNTAWKKLVIRNDEDRWPLGTSETSKYFFNFNYGDKLLSEFEWNDYRGDALTIGKATDESVKDLFQIIDRSSCLLICVSGEHLNVKADEETRVLTDSTRINFLLNQFAINHGLKQEDPFPVAIVLTKYDLCTRNKEEVLKDIKQVLFPNLFREGWLVMVCSTTLGMDLARSKVLGRISPLGSHQPVIFALFTQFIKKQKTYVSEISLLEKKQDEIKSKNWLWKVWNRADTKKLDLVFKSRDMSINLDIMSERLEKLKASFLQESTFFENGNELNLDIKKEP